MSKAPEKTREALDLGDRLHDLDPRTTLVYDDEAVAAVFRALEGFSMSYLGERWARHEDMEVRALGNVMIKIAEVRHRRLQGDPPFPKQVIQMVAADNLADILRWFYKGSPADDRPTTALADYAKAIQWLDERCEDMGTQGPGLFREIMRGD